MTFKYTEQGAVGLLEGKKAIYIVARGGKHSGEPEEMGERYLRTIMGFMGITDFSTVSTELTGVLLGRNLTESVNNAVEQAKLEALKF